MLEHSRTDDLQPFHLSSRVGPLLPQDASFVPPAANDVEDDLALSVYRVWVFARMLGSSDQKLSCPAFNGFVSVTERKPERQSTIDCFDPIDHPFTSYATIRELLKRSELAINNVGQTHMLSTFNLGGCMKALTLIRPNLSLYYNHVVSPRATSSTQLLSKNGCSGGEPLATLSLIWSAPPPRFELQTSRSRDERATVRHP